MTPAVLALLQRIQAEGPVAFVAGWAVHNSTEHEAFRDGLVVEVGPKVPPGIFRLACLRCGDMNDVLLPISVGELAPIHDRFTARHKGCKEREDAR